MTPLGSALAVWGALGSAVWIATLFRATRSLLRLPDLGDGSPARDADLPSLAVIVPARDEAGAIEAALRSILSQRYPDLEVVVVDDGSTDATGEIVDRLAGEDPRLVALHLEDPPPEGWLGKIHAVERATRETSAEWLLYTDADVRFAPDAARRAVARAERERLDHLSAIPTVESPTAPMRVVVAAFGLLALVHAMDHHDPDHEDAFGIGAFNLVRRAALERTPGWEWLRREPADDVGLARMIRAAGGRSSLVFGHDRVRLRWYGGLGATVRGFEKNAFGFAGRYRPGRTLAASAGGAVFALAPFAALAAPAWWARAAVGGVAIGLLAFAAVRRRRLGLPFWPPLLAPLGVAALAWAIARSGLVAWRRGGIAWRGRLYPVQELREGQRVWLERWL
ncbi:MAG: glycosyltransferase family 2 protein [Gemmatimonadota bacterium]|nr:glycosyltransferase family 2 protein [Gemmatimonadota bacterium]